MDIIVEKLLKEGVRLTKRNYRLFAFWNADYIPSPEESAEFPDDYEDWPESEEAIN